MYSLTDKVAIVTGASRGIGQGIAEQLAKVGATVVCASRTEADIKVVADSINANNGNAHYFAADISNAESFSNLVKFTMEQYGHIDILVNNAGITRDTLLMRMSEDDWDMVLNINLKGAFNGTKAVTRPMMKQRSGRIINISSVVGLTGNAGQSNYAASKAGLIGFTKSIAKEYASRGITVNCVAPGYIETEMTNAITDKAKETLLSQIPLGRIGKAADIAAMVNFLASDEAGYITGQTFTVDGGMTMI
ncbi:MAG: 3-oxoacyl-[acyl-carrier-protein] reductase [Candidatus Marinimicrobia bacterium]|nr:3-oxoacyl-[acyl-carrier-protein] reductase [Candidatus Neomarinimicrobiota bacterium]